MPTENENSVHETPLIKGTLIEGRNLISDSILDGVEVAGTHQQVVDAAKALQTTGHMLEQTPSSGDGTQDMLQAFTDQYGNMSNAMDIGGLVMPYGSNSWGSTSGSLFGFIRDKFAAALQEYKDRKAAGEAPGIEPPSPPAAHDPSLSGNGESDTMGNNAPPQIRDPIVIDLNGNGIDLISSASSHARFDIDLDGFREQVSWVGPNDGILVRDVNGNGTIDDISELFGSAVSDG